MRSGLFRGPGACAVLGVLLVGAAMLPQTAAGQVEEGRRLAQERCARCHAIGLQGESPHKDAPPFREFGRRWNVEGLEEALAEGIVTGHPDMPEIVFEPQEIGAFIDYLKSLETGGAARRHGAR